MHNVRTSQLIMSPFYMQPAVALRKEIRFYTTMIDCTVGNTLFKLRHYCICCDINYEFRSALFGFAINKCVRHGA